MSSTSHQTMSRHRNASMSSAGRSARKTEMAAAPKDFSSPNALMRYFEPTAATASMFLYGQGNSVVVAHHDSLTIERRFSRHSSEVQLLAVDTQSDVGAGRLVVSYDAEMTAIVWDLMTGDEVARFASYETLTCAAWMRNGNVAFGNTQGNIILFEPTTSEHISARTIDQIAITALAPAADCRTFAIGYQNGSLLIATLQPRFTILHNLSTNRAPSPIVTLSWHASSSRQKADMLAVQTDDGDLRVWSVSKSYNSDDPAKIVRILKKSEVYQNGPNWMGWSKNGRIIQFSSNETLSWDVRTKHVTHDDVPTLDHVRGLAVYGPGATLFTLGANNTVQQFDLNMPSVMVNNVQHPANLLPPSPPVSIEEQAEQGVVIIGAESDSGASMPADAIVSESDEDHMSPLARIVRHAEPEYDQYEQDYYGNDSYAPSISSRSGASSTISKSSVNSGTRGRRAPSVVSRGMTENTYISAGSSLRSSAQPPYGDKDAYSISSVGSQSVSSSTRSSRHKPSRLRNELPRSPEDNKVQDLFKFTRSRLHDIPYKRTAGGLDHSRSTNDDLRRQMLSIIFGWNKEVEDLVRDELSRHPTGSPSRILLSKWLGDIDSDVMTATSENMTSSDWMLLALSGIGGQASQHKLGRAYVQRLLENGDLHAAATIMLGMGDHNDAIEIYVSHRKFMEALILLCLFFPSVWERQAQVIKKWGEFAIQHGQQQLAIRCFACSGQESSEPWASPSAAQVTFQSMHPSIPEILSPPLSPPDTNFGPQRSIAKTSALKLITSFGDQSKKSKFFAGDDGQTPIAVGMTPIIESATTPGARDPTTAVIRPSDRSAFNTPSTALPPAGFGRKRLPSIGELTNPNAAVNNRPRDLLVPKASAEDSSVSQRPGHVRRASTEEPYNPGLMLARASTASPMMMRENHRPKDAPMPSPSPESFQALLAKGRNSRNGARERKPEGMELQLQTLEAAQSDAASPEQTGNSARFHWPTRRRGPGSVAGSVASSVTSQSSAGGRSYRSNAAGRSRQEYISSLDTANAYKKARSRERSSTRQDDRGTRSRDNSRTRRPAMPEMYDDRGRSVARQRTPKPGKQSPTSPLPMSPEDLINLSTPKMYDNGLEDESVLPLDLDSRDPATARKSSVIRRTSPRSRISSRASSRNRASPERRPPALDLRGRSNIHGLSDQQSPTSPIPLSAPHVYGSDDDEDYRAALEAQEAFRTRHNRSASIRDPQSPAVGRRGERSESQRRTKTPALPEPPLPQRQRSVSRTGDLKAIMTERQLKKEAAARELEERRKSLARRPSAPLIPLPDHLSPILDRAPSAFELPSTTYRDPIIRSHTAEPTRSTYSRNGNRPTIGLPATPKAMRLKFDSAPTDVPKIPTVPTSARTSPGSTGQRSPQQTVTPPEKSAPLTLTLLPSTVYSPPSRPFIERCMSAPIPEEPAHNRRQRAGSMSRKMSTDANATGMWAIDELVIGGSKHARRASRDDQIPPPPPPPPAPPVLHELQHLAIPLRPLRLPPRSQAHCLRWCYNRGYHRDCHGRGREAADSYRHPNQ
ncbi:gem associated protein 5 [Microdochium nivale]|nr:gem associated protein 5 [Microdochium nivale]